MARERVNKVRARQSGYFGSFPLRQFAQLVPLHRSPMRISRANSAGALRNAAKAVSGKSMVIVLIRFLAVTHSKST